MSIAAAYEGEGGEATREVWRVWGPQLVPPRTRACCVGVRTSAHVSPQVLAAVSSVIARNRQLEEALTQQPKGVPPAPQQPQLQKRESTSRLPPPPVTLP